MTSSTDSLAFTVPLTADDEALAQQFAQRMPSVDKAEQVRRNTLAVLATHYYLKLLGLTSDLKASTSWDFLHQLTGNAADLKVPNGHLTCCPIQSEETLVRLPDSEDGLGYVVVQLSEDYHKAKLLGFASVNAHTLTLQQLEPLGNLVNLLVEPPHPVRLRNWLENKTSTTWATLETLMSDIQREPHIAMAPVNLDNQSTVQQRLQTLIQELYDQTGITASTDNPTIVLSQLIQQVHDDELRWRSAELLWELDPNHPSSPILRAKDLGLFLAGHSIALLVGLLPKIDNQVLVLVRVCSIGPSPVLPSGIQFIGQDIDGAQIFDLSSRQRDDYIQFKFTADAGDRFSLTVRLEEAQVTEYFLV